MPFQSPGAPTYGEVISRKEPRWIASAPEPPVALSTPLTVIPVLLRKYALTPASMVSVTPELIVTSLVIS